jgi:hypothetical protein
MRQQRSDPLKKQNKHKKQRATDRTHMKQGQKTQEWLNIDETLRYKTTNNIKSDLV